MKKFYLTTAIPYVNAKPHIGHALEFVQADVVARYHRLCGRDVCLLSGGDENSLKNVQAAEEAGEELQSFVDKNTELFLKLAGKIDVQFDAFQKGSDQLKHHSASQILWKKCEQSGDIYKKTYSGLYCVGCELFYEQEELNEKGECFEHPGKKLVEVSEENYFFRLSKYQQKIIEIIQKDILKIIPQNRKNEVLAFLKNPLRDISISRSNERARNWGVAVPDDPGQRMYVWFDALNIYQSGVGFGWDPQMYSKWWPADLHIIGKGILRFHAVYWPAFLMSAGLEIPRELFVHGYLTIDGQKMSKTLGNVIDPVEMVDKYGVDPLRYYLLAEIPSWGDGDFSQKRFVELYNADLANGLGNLIARVAKMCQNSSFPVFDKEGAKISSVVVDNIEIFSFNKALQSLWQRIRESDKYINEKEPWKITGERELYKILQPVVETIRQIGFDLQPFLPSTAEKIIKQFAGEKISTEEPYFRRINI